MFARWTRLLRDKCSNLASTTSSGFHQVAYAPDALDLTIGSANRYLPHKPLPGKALELLDAAGAYVRLREPALPAEIVQSIRQLNLLRSRVQEAEENHEFEKARFYSGEQQKEKQNLEALEKKYGIGKSAPLTTVTSKDVEDVIAQLSSYPFRA